ncbi:hypothetical protein Tco_0721799 [Tanacetum coccineum]
MEDSDDPLSVFCCNENEYMTVEDFDESKEYYRWRNELLASLATKNKLPFLEESSRPAPESPDLDRWHRCNRLVKIWILKCLSEDVKEYVSHYNFAYEIWNKLESTYGTPTLRRKESLAISISLSLESFAIQPTVDLPLVQKMVKFSEVEAAWTELDYLDGMIGCYIRFDRDRQRALSFYNAVCSKGEYPQLKKDILDDANITFDTALKLLKNYMGDAKPMAEEHHLKGTHVCADRIYQVSVCCDIALEILDEAMEEGEISISRFYNHLKFVNSVEIVARGWRRRLCSSCWRTRDGALNVDEGEPSVDCVANATIGYCVNCVGNATIGRNEYFSV